MMNVRDILTLAYNKRMKSETAARILSLNHQFYQSFAEDFSETRQRLQPGVLSLVNRFQPESSILDLGCGNGELARELAREDFSGSYLGTDFSSNLLQKAGLGIPAEFPAEFLELYLSETDWSGLLPGTHLILYCRLLSSIMSRVTMDEKMCATISAGIFLIRDASFILTGSS